MSQKVENYSEQSTEVSGQKIAGKVLHHASELCSLQNLSKQKKSDISKQSFSISDFFMLNYMTVRKIAKI